MKATFEDRGRLELKNIERPIPAFSVIWDPRDWPVSTLVADVPSMDPPVGITSAGSPSASVRTSSSSLRSKRISIWAAVASAGCVLLAGAGYLAFASRPSSPITEHRRAIAILSGKPSRPPRRQTVDRGACLPKSER